jgi:hypothetical protein
MHATIALVAAFTVQAAVKLLAATEGAVWN